MKIYNFEQKSEEWINIRKGKMTASHAVAIGNYGKGLNTYIITLMSEYFSKGIKEEYINPAMERGNELEMEARTIYEMETGQKVDEVGFIELDEFSGCSPDGLVGDDGVIEIKCLKDLTCFELILSDELTPKDVESSYMWQIQMNLMITERKWCDYVVYNPNYDKSLSIIRVLPDEKMFSELKIGIAKGKEMINYITSKYLNKCKTK